ncbi:MAG: major capsid protein [bacterium]
MAFISPSPSALHIDSSLTKISLMTLQTETAYVASKVFPNIPVSKESDFYHVYDDGSFFRSQMHVRQPGTESAAIQWSLSKDKYQCQNYALHALVTDGMRANADDSLDLDWDTTTLLTHQKLLKHEKEWVETCFVASDPGDIWDYALRGKDTRSTTVDPTNLDSNDVVFWNRSDSTPIADILYMRSYVKRKTGINPNTLTIGNAVYDALCEHPDVVARINRGQTSGLASVTLQQMADLFRIKEIFIMEAVEEKTPEGLESEKDYIGGNHALLTYKPLKPGLRTPSTGYTFNWSGLLGSRKSGLRVKKFRVPTLAADWLEIETSFTEKITSKGMAGFFSSIVE